MLCSGSRVVRVILFTTLLCFVGCQRIDHPARQLAFEAQNINSTTDDTKVAIEAMPAAVDSNSGTVQENGVTGTDGTQTARSSSRPESFRNSDSQESNADGSIAEVTAQGSKAEESKVEESKVEESIDWEPTTQKPLEQGSKFQELKEQVSKEGKKWESKVAENETKEQADAASESSSAYLGIRHDRRAASAKIGYVLPNTPAAKAGLKVGDVVIAVDGQLVSNIDDLVSTVAEYLPGDEVPFVVVRGNDQLMLPVELGKQ